MNNIIYIILVLAIVIIVAIFLMRKKKTPEPTRSTAPAPANRAASPVAGAGVTHDPSAPIPTPTAPSHQDRLKTAQQFIDQQRYDDAIRELKQGLITHPNQKDLSLRLLNVYAITNNNEEFGALYDTIKTQGDAATVAEANNIKLLIDAEQSSSLPKAAAAATVAAASGAALHMADDSDDAGLDFNLSDSDAPDTNTAAPAAPTEHETNHEEVLSFDDLESQLLSDDTATPEAPAAPVTQTNANDDFSLSLDDLDTEDAADAKLDTPTQSAPADTTNDGAFELSLDDLEPQSVQEIELDESSVDATDDLSEFGLTEQAPSAPTTLSLDEPKSVDAPVADIDHASELNIDELSSDDLSSNDLNIDEPATDEFDLDLSEPVNLAADTQTTQSQSAPTLAEADTDAFSLSDEDFSFDSYGSDDAPATNTDTASTATDTKAEPSNASSLADTSLALDDTSLASDETLADDIPSTVKAEEAGRVLDDGGLADNQLHFDEPVLESHDAPVSPETSLASLADTAQSNEPNANVLGEGVEDTLSQLDALSFDDTADDTGIVTDTDAVIESNDALAPTQPSPAAPVTQTPASVDTPAAVEPQGDSQFATDFDFINELDGAQVTLDLASQYMELGEYESAKRLLNEVIEKGNSTQQEQAQALLAKTV